ncbi:hypothetical protein U9K52_08650 [Chryseobacterium sp. MHB01]|uniref:hypothetical protein n=1 Tax=Chryseobacterium sp. MHB01 TaxID=3109433 RepID=UPI002AFE6158|nr:hypothetical protein [Chryseobacterium sp. MHB01]MEA1848976.1 hypothetical protein [Chryseobacterium sp. MHB01]
MKNRFKNYYVIQKDSGEILPNTVQPQRKMCIDEFLRGGDMTWKEVKKYGWNCIKVNIIFQRL